MSTRLASLCSILLAASVTGQDAAPPWSEVRAVLEAFCLRCHGGQKVESEFRLATAATFAHGGARGAVFDADEPAESRILEVVRYANPDLAMPPSGKLDPADLDVLERWILAGAAWPTDATGTLADPARFPDHAEARPAASGWWAYEPLAAPSPPDSARGVDADADPIAAFVAARLAAAELAAQPRATAETLLRRATFDLTGLPPTPAERRDFAAAVEREGFDAAWSARLDALIASPRYGEHQARLWLDQVRYAETNGYERDATKTNIWRYRDWVIRAFQSGLPYDQFVIQQLAGDELAALAGDAAAPDLQIATGYYRLNVWDDEPADHPQAIADERADIVDTTAQVFLGSSLGCARCHDHKADPLGQDEYFAFTAWFNNVRGYGGGRFSQALGKGVTTLLADAPTADQISQAARDARIREVDAALQPFADRLAAKAAAAGAVETTTLLVRDARHADGAAQWRVTIEDAPAGWHTAGFDDSEWPLAPGGFGTEGTPGARVGTVWGTPQIHLRTRFELVEVPESLVLSFHHDEDVEVYLNGVEVFARRGYRGDYAEVQLDQEAVDALVVGSNVLAVACRQSGGGQFIDVGLRVGWLDDQKARLRRLAMRAERWFEGEDLAAVERLLTRRAKLAAQPVAEPYPALVVSEFGREAPPQHVHLRGSVHAPGAVVEPGVPAAFLAGGIAPPAPAVDVPGPTTGRRLALARWMVGDAAHLTARVMVNRIWQSHFGRGLCPTPGDFGRLGDKPSHPELLDWLARDFVASGWSIQAMHRRIMKSAVYLRASSGDAAALAKDPRNSLLWRYPPRRLTAEQFRDGILQVSGEIRHALFGPSVFPPMPAEVLATSSRPGQAWGRSSAEDAVRRSIYVFVKRSLRVPLLEGLDQPDPDLPCADRFPTNVPTQALMSLNGEFPHRMARAFAARLARETADEAAQVDRAYLLAFGRAPTTGERTRDRAFLASLREEHGLDPDAARALFCLALFNRNEFLWID